MGETKQKQSQAKKELDEKLRLSTPHRQMLEELAVACAKDPSPDNTFQYAFALSKSSEKSELRYAITILDGLVKEGYSHEVDCSYAAATALYLLGDYEEARFRCENILRANPDSRIASELHLASIESQELKEQDHIKQVAVGGTIAVAALGVIAGVASVMMASNKK
jgi:mitochondrial fission 1 protein